MELWLPYGLSEIPVRVPDERLIDILKPADTPPVSDPIGETNRLLGSNESFLRKAGEASRVCLVVGSCGSRQLAAELCLEVLRRVPNPQGSATVLCTEESPQLEADSVGGVRVLNHSNTSQTASIAAVDSQFTPEVDCDFVNADLRVLIGELRPHAFLKYSGVCDLIFPYLGSEASTRKQLSGRPLSSAEALHEERLQIARSFDNTYVIGFALGLDLQPVKIVFDTVDSGLVSLELTINELTARDVTKRSDIIVMSAGGAPFDTTLARAAETFPVGVEALKRDGALIVSAECQGGHGAGQFYDWSAEHKEPRYLESRLRHHFSYEGCLASVLARTLQTHRVYLVSTIPDHYVENVFGMRAAQTVNGALQSAQRALGSDSTISVIPNASRVTPRLRDTVKQ